jgi:PTH2 family peptidyl-tRNA hydrolase
MSDNISNTISKSKSKKSKKNKHLNNFTNDSDEDNILISEPTQQIKSAKSVKSVKSAKSAKSAKSNEFTSYIIVNSDLHMSKGKIASQSAHAILNVYRFMANNSINKVQWEQTGEKIIVLKASYNEIKQILSYYEEHIPGQNKLNVFPVYDAGKTEVAEGSLTVLATTPITDDIKPDFLKQLKLL